MKKILGVLFLIIIFSTDCFAMSFSQPVEVGEIGFPIQSPFHGYVVKGATYNDGVHTMKTENL